MPAYEYIENIYKVENNQVVIPLAEVGINFQKVIFIVIIDANDAATVLSYKNAVANLKSNDYFLRWDNINGQEQLKLRALIYDRDIFRATANGKITRLFPGEVNFTINN